MKYWTPEEDAHLRSLRRRYGNVAEVAARIPGRSVNACRQHARLLGIGFSPAVYRPRWAAYTSDLLTHYWNVEKLSAGECAKRLGISRNAVIGRAHRLGLDARESPIKRPGKPVEQPTDGCQWLTGDRPFTPCSAAREPGKPYCAKHCARAFTAKPPKKEKAVFTFAPKGQWA
jgi:GcrA cell cycle regulator